jgi:probable FeS assembly SUF system protein SufT
MDPGQNPGAALAPAANGLLPPANRLEPGQTVELRRECDATLVPSGQKVRLAAGLSVNITQSLGGAYTVVVGGSLARLESQDLDALGLTPVPPKDPANVAAISQPVGESSVWEQLKTCYDPEIPVNIVELGLIYDLHITPETGGGSLVEVKMTLTAPGCGMGAMIADDVQRKVLALPGVNEARVELVWDPPWNQGMMTEAAKLELGLM